MLLVLVVLKKLKNVKQRPPHAVIAEGITWSHFIQARRVQSVRDQHKVTHAVAVKRVEREPGGGSVTSNSRSGNRQLSFL